MNWGGFVFVSSSCDWMALLTEQIHVYESATTSPCSPISRSWTSALMNFVTEHSFGCAYPRLTYGRQAIVSDLALHTMNPYEASMLATMAGQGFSFGVEPSRWAPYAARLGPHLPPGVFPCYRDLYICPDQARYFGDRGSLVTYLHPLSDDYRAIRSQAIAPHGPMVIWRLWSSSVCEYGCSHNDEQLPPGVVSVLLLLVDDSVFSRCPPAAVSRRARTAVTSLPQKVRVRGRSVTI